MNVNLRFEIKYGKIKIREAERDIDIEVLK